MWIKRGDFVVVKPIEEGDKGKAEISSRSFFFACLYFLIFFVNNNCIKVKAEILTILF